MEISSNHVHRKTRLSEAYLGHRITPSQIQHMLTKLDDPDEKWNDTFEKLTADRVVESGQGGSEPLEALGLLQRYQKLDDESVWSAEERAIHRHISKLDTPEREKPEVKSGQSNLQFSKTVREHFDDWDRNNNTRLEVGEVDLLMSGGFYGSARETADSPETASALALLRRHLDLLQSANPNDGAGVSKHDLILMEEASTDLLAQMKGVVSEDYQEFNQEARQMTERKPLDQEDIRPEAIHQGVVGSCVLLSTMLWMPSDNLKDMIAANDNRESFKVSFQDGTEEIVQEPTVAERLYHARGENLDRWPALFEIAMAQKLYHQVDTEDSALRSAIDGIEPERAIKALTGRETDKRNLDELSVNQTRKALAELTSRGGPVICGSRPTALGDFISNEELANGIQNSHCYAILNFDADLDTVELRNPWGKGEWLYQYSPEDGTFEMPARDFYSSFRWVAGVADDKSPSSTSAKVAPLPVR